MEIGIGELVRDLRKARGWSQGRLATEINDAFGTTLTREYVSGWERGKVRPGPFYLRALSQVLGVPEAALQAGGPADGATTAALAPAVASDLLRMGFAARLRGGPSADDWEDRLAAYGAAYMSSPAADLQRRVAEDLVVVQQQLDEPRMWSAAARLMTVYATTFPRQECARTVMWFRMAADAADRSGDVGVRVWVRGRGALALGYGGTSTGLAELLADQALALTDKPSVGLLHATLGKAYAAALRGDRATALRLADRGRRIFDAAYDPAAQLSDYSIPSWRMNGFLSLLSARLGDEKQATAAREAALHELRELPERLPRFATHLELHKGLTLVRAGDREGGVACARAALEALPQEKWCGTLQMLMAEIAA
ncbi:helix-turn-helix transcriptional regulator [Streptomyces rectiverticillatus]|uniref:helix-turn-helix domain-containing protein n=1 Tax=Streptomyces rectiverticillatus TaxID=173860 RepID=UPI0031B5E2F9